MNLGALANIANIKQPERGVETPLVTLTKTLKW